MKETKGFKWIKVENELHGFTVIGENEYKSFEIFKGKRGWKLYRVSGGGIESFQTRSLAVKWAEKLWGIRRLSSGEKTK